ncbi:hypothetical protein K469DRAFT_541323, partial [Zopfia rhizophila CBS 207.26]
LAILDSFNSILFFHREIFMFFKYYIRVEKKSVFKLINKYFNIIKINKCGLLYIYRLL